MSPAVAPGGRCERDGGVGRRVERLACGAVALTERDSRLRGNDGKAARTPPPSPLPPKRRRDLLLL